MKNIDAILGLFFANEDEMVYDKIKISEDLTEEREDNLKMLSFKYLGPVFLTEMCNKGNPWNINLVESGLILQSHGSYNEKKFQSFFNINSSNETIDGRNNLSALVASPYTEDIKEIADKLCEYILPAIIQGKIVDESFLGNRFKYSKFIQNELTRGLNLIDYSLGSSRKVYWEEQNNYYCVGLIERIVSKYYNATNLLTFDKDNLLRKKCLEFIPSYYVMAILPDYYEKLIDETLKLFNVTTIYPNIRLIRLHSHEKKVIYLEEYIVEKNIKKSYGVILIENPESFNDLNKIPFYKKHLRLLVDKQNDVHDIILKINPKFSFKKWDTLSNESLNDLEATLDN
ncbi:MAG: hypothetical protein ACTSPN_11425 [Promethearchaeota archaeon]